MTPKDIDALPAGRELDALVAEQVMGVHIPTPGEMEGEARRTWVVQPSAMWFHSLGGFGAWEDEKGLHLEARIKPYSTDITAAWAVVESFNSYRLLWNAYTKRHEASLTRYKPEMFALAAGETAPLAISRAALKAVCS